MVHGGGTILKIYRKLLELYFLVDVCAGLEEEAAACSSRWNSFGTCELAGKKETELPSDDNIMSIIHTLLHEVALYL